MRTAYTVEQVRAAEQELMARLPEGSLMQRAAAGLATSCLDSLGRAYGARVSLVVGAGDNGGDALYAGALLARRGVQVTAVVLDRDKVHAGGLGAMRRAGGVVYAATDYPADLFDRAELVLDGIVGIGGQPGLRPAAERVCDDVERACATVVAVDLPSGIDVDSGETPARQVSAEITVTFGAHKIGLLTDPAAEAAGVVELIDIGLGAFLPERPALEALQEYDVRRLLPAPGRESHKYSRGVLGVVAGSEQYPGAAGLVVAGALGMPLGMVRFIGPASVAAEVRARAPEVVGDGRVQAWTIGSGLGDDPARAADVRRALDSDLPVIVDADGLRHLPERCTSPVLLTPHAGELARMLGLERAEVEARRLRHARAAAERWNATVLLKGAATLVVTPDGWARVNPVATPWSGTAGSGDVLAGCCGALLAAGLDPLDAGSVGAYVHGSASLLASAGGPVTASGIAEAVPDVVVRLLS